MSGSERQEGNMNVKVKLSKDGKATCEKMPLGRRQSCALTAEHHMQLSQ